jgi:hypothetical protein
MALAADRQHVLVVATVRDTYDVMNHRRRLLVAVLTDPFRFGHGLVTTTAPGPVTRAPARR